MTNHRLTGASRERNVTLLEINPDVPAEEITRVKFGCDYGDALTIVGGSLSQANKRLETDLRTRSQSSGPNSIERRYRCWSGGSSRDRPEIIATVAP
jgi:hypothetical protein